MRGPNHGGGVCDPCPRGRTSLEVGFLEVSAALSAFKERLVPQGGVLRPAPTAWTNRKLRNSKLYFQCAGFPARTIGF